MGQVEQMDPIERPSLERKLGSSVCGGNRSGPICPPYVFKAPVSDDGEAGNGDKSVINNGYFVESRWCRDSKQAGRTDGEGRFGEVGQDTKSECPVGTHDLLEDRVPVGRGGDPVKRAGECDKQKRGDCRLGNEPQGQKAESVLPWKVGSYRGRPGGGDRVRQHPVRKVRKTDGVGHSKVGAGMEKGEVHEEVLGALHQARGDKSPVRTVGERRGYQGGINKPPREAQHNRRPLEHNDPVRRKPSGIGPGIANIGGDDSPLTCIRKMRAQFTHRGKSTRLPSTVEERGAPLHVSKIPEMNLRHVRSRMLPSIRKRFEHVWSLTFNYINKQEKESRKKKSRFSADHAKKLAECHIAVPFNLSESRAHNVPFTVFEERESGNRQRFILWTKEENERITGEGYVPFVPLKHISEYLGAVDSEVASLRDFKTGFYQVAIPEEARGLFAFQDSEGASYALTRLPMGHVCAPEIMNTVAAVVAGDPLFVKDRYAEKDVGIHWWIDNIRYFGGREKVHSATERLDKLASECNISWKPQDTVNCGGSYDFLGVSFLHNAKEVGLGAKIRRGIFKCDLNRMTASSIESLGGRLLHASAISGVPPGRYWFALKFLRRVTNKLNKGSLRVEQEVVIPPLCEKRVFQLV